jgi:hypothetical protein
MSPFSRMARLLLILHSLVNIALGAYSFVNIEEYAAITGIDAPDRALQSIGKLYLVCFFSFLLPSHLTLLHLTHLSLSFS